MFYKKNLTYIPYSRQVITIPEFRSGINSVDNDSVVPFKYAKLSYNFSVLNGGLKSCDGLKIFESFNEKPSSKINLGAIVPLSTYYYNYFDEPTNSYQNMLLVYASDKNMYYLNLDKDGESLTLISGMTFNSKPFGINYKYNGSDVMIFTSPIDNLIIYKKGNEPIIITDAPKITSMCLHYERIFATTIGEKTSLWFSDDFDPSNWNANLDEGGFIDFQDERGSLNNVISFLDYVYIFRNYGITRLSAYGNQTEFYTTQLFVSSGKIVGGTVTFCGDRILFLAENGLYKFDGLNTIKILDGLNNLIDGVDNLDAKGEFLNGKFYLILNIKIEKEIKRALLRYDIKSNTSELTILPIEDISKICAEHYTKLVFIVNSKICEFNKNSVLLEKPLEKLWISHKSDFGYSLKNKIVREINVFLDGSCVIEIISDLNSQKQTFTGKKSIVKGKFSLKGNIFEIKITSFDNNVEIGKLSIVYDILR